MSDGSIMRAAAVTLFEVQFTVGSSPFTMDIPELKVGDTILRIWQPSSPTANVVVSAAVDNVVTTDGELEWLHTDWAATYKMIVLRLGA